MNVFYRFPTYFVLVYNISAVYYDRLRMGYLLYFLIPYSINFCIVFVKWLVYFYENTELWQIQVG